MSAVIPLEGLEDALTHGPLGGSLEVMLWKNSGYTPSSSSVYSDLTENTFTGYARVAPSFGSVGTDGSGHAQSVAALVSFIASASVSEDCYGWALVNASTSKIRALDLLPSTPFHFANSGDAVTVALTELLGTF